MKKVEDFSKLGLSSEIKYNIDMLSRKINFSRQKQKEFFLSSKCNYDLIREYYKRRKDYEELIEERKKLFLEHNYENSKKKRKRYDIEITV